MYALLRVCVSASVSVDESDGAWRICACISTWAARRERYTGKEDGGTGSVCVCVCVCLFVRVHDCASMIGGVGVANRGWSVI